MCKHREPPSKPHKTHFLPPKASFEPNYHLTVLFDPLCTPALDARHQQLPFWPVLGASGRSAAPGGGHGPTWLAVAAPRHEPARCGSRGCTGGRLGGLILHPSMPDFPLAEARASPARPAPSSPDREPAYPGCSRATHRALRHHGAASGAVTSGAAKVGRESALMATWGDQGRRGSLGHAHGQLLGLCWTEISRGSRGCAA